jgi:hypothetical protein
LRDDDVGERSACGLCTLRRGRAVAQRTVMDALDHGAEQRFLGLEVMIERLPRQACGLRGFLD